MATSKDFDKSLGFLLQSEGGFNNIPEDPGGATNCGISLRFLQGAGDYELGDLDQDGDIDIKDIALITSAGAGRIYKKYFWDYFPMAAIPAQIAYILFDVAVNSGQKVAVKLLQSVLGCGADGVIGPNTLYCLSRIDSPQFVAEKMLTLRAEQYKQYVAQNPKLGKFLNGWMNRIASAKKHLLEFN